MMREELKLKLDKVARSDRRRNLTASLLVASGFVVFILIILLFFPSSVAEIKGTAVGLTATLTDEGNKPVMMVKLDDGSIVRALMPKNLQFRKDEKVELLRTDSITGAQSFAVIKYVQSTHNK